MIDKRALLLTILLLSACTRAPQSSLSLPDPSLLDDSEEIQIQAYRTDAAKLLAVQDYDGLEKLATTDRTMDSPLGSGMLPISSFYDIISSERNQSADAFKQSEDALNAWIQARPDSVTAKIALAITLTNDAWFARGSGYANTVSQDGWTIFGQKLKQASDVLENVKDKRQAYPDWYKAMNTVGLGLSEDKDSYLARVQEGTSLHPQAMDIYSGTVIYLLPRWYGSNREIVDFATKSADQLGGDAGDMLYARLAKTVWSYTHDNVFSGTGFSWPRVRHGMELILNRYPHSLYMANCFGVFASQALDHATGHTLFAYLGDHYMQAVWQSREYFDAAQAWAQSSGQPVQLSSTSAPSAPDQPGTDAYNQGNAAASRGDKDAAIADYTQAIQINPKLVAAYFNRGRVYGMKGDKDKALADYDQAILLEPKLASPYLFRGAMYASKSDTDQALANYDQAIDLNPKFGEAYFLRASIYLDKGDYDKALTNYNQALQLDPNSLQTYNDRAWLLATCPQAGLRDGKKAVEDAMKACDLSQWKLAAMIDTLAAAYAEAGDFDNAVKWETKCLEYPNLVVGQDARQNASQTAEAKSRLALYQAHQPYHEAMPKIPGQPVPPSTPVAGSTVAPDSAPATNNPP